jgi:hypothetical protein
MCFSFRIFWQHNIIIPKYEYEKLQQTVFYYYAWRMRGRVREGGREGGRERERLIRCACETYIVLIINYWILPAPLLKSFNYISGQKQTIAGSVMKSTWRLGMEKKETNHKGPQETKHRNHMSEILTPYSGTTFHCAACQVSLLV